MAPSLLQAGEIVNAHGVHGEVKILPWADGPEFLLQFDTLYLQDRPYKVEFSRVHKSCVLCKLEGVDDAAAATHLRGQVVSIDRDGLELPEGAVFIADLIGLMAQTADGRHHRHGPSGHPHAGRRCARHPWRKGIYGTQCPRLCPGD